MTHQIDIIICSHRESLDLLVRGRGHPHLTTRHAAHTTGHPRELSHWRVGRVHLWVAAHAVDTVEIVGWVGVRSTGAGVDISHHPVTGGYDRWRQTLS